jgi:hypothetical protein
MDGATDAREDSGGAGSDAAQSDGGLCELRLTLCDGVCVDTSSDPDHCGRCDQACPADELCALGMCVSMCPPPLAMCGRQCVDLNTDPFNCGRCGNVCRSRLCNAGVCHDAQIGHVVLIGHNYAETIGEQDRILANAVFLSSSPARVLAYEGLADTGPGSAVAHANAGITNSGGGRRWMRTVLADPARISVELSVDRYDVMLVYEQTHATDAQVANLAAAMGSALASFARAGGVVIVLDGATENSGTFPIANATGLLSIAGEANVDGHTAVQVAIGDAIASGVVANYVVQPTTANFMTADPYTVFSCDDRPVVLHRPVAP